MRSQNAQSTRALVLARVAYGEADLIVHLFTEELGHISAMARGARRNSKKFSGNLEPLHTLQVRVQEKKTSELYSLVESEIFEARLKLTSELERLELASKAMKWLRSTLAIGNQEAALYLKTEAFLNELNQEATLRPRVHLIYFGFQLLKTLGFALQLRACLRCQRPCQSGKAALFSPEQGGIVCRGCGGGPMLLGGHLREELARASEDERQNWSPEEEGLALAVLERSIFAHMGVDFS